MSSPAAVLMIVSEISENAFRIRSAVGLSVIFCLFSGCKPGSLACVVSRDRRRTNSVTVQDRKSTRLNSSHVSISYAVFCLKKKKNIHNTKHIDNQQQQL